MDFKSIQTTLSQKSKQFADAAKDFGKKTLLFTGKQLSSTSLYIETNEAYDRLLEEKRSIVIAYDDANEDITKEIVLMMPVWSAQALLDVATIRYLNEEKSHDVILTQKFELPIEMRVRYQNIERYRLKDMESIKAWWKNRDYLNESIPNQEKNEKHTPPAPTPTDDPLNSLQ